MTNNIKIAIAVLVLAVAGYFIYSSMSSGDDGKKTRNEDKIMRTNQTDDPVALGSKEVEFELLDEMSHYGQ